MKIIALVKNPTDQLISHYQMFRRFHNEGRKGYDLGDLFDFVKSEIVLFSQDKPTRLLFQGIYHQHLQK